MMSWHQGNLCWLNRFQECAWFCGKKTRNHKYLNSSDCSIGMVKNNNNCTSRITCAIRALPIRAVHKLIIYELMHDCTAATPACVHIQTNYDIHNRLELTFAWLCPCNVLCIVYLSAHSRRFVWYSIFSCELFRVCCVSNYA